MYVCRCPLNFCYTTCKKTTLFVFLTCKCTIDTNCVSGAIRLEDCNDGIENNLISCHFSKEGLEECELRDFALIIRRRLKNELKRRYYYAVPPFPKQNQFSTPLDLLIIFYYPLPQPHQFQLASSQLVKTRKIKEHAKFLAPWEESPMQRTLSRTFLVFPKWKQLIVKPYICLPKRKTDKAFLIDLCRARCFATEAQEIVWDLYT